MRVRHLVAARKYIDNETACSSKDMQPRYAPIYPKDETNPRWLGLEIGPVRYSHSKLRTY
jgi:hypothetical protein